jgi:hypothetical protein
MKTVTLEEFEHNFDVFMDDVIENGCHYKITYGNNKAVMVVPYAEYELLLNTYKDWVEETKDCIEESF